MIRVSTLFLALLGLLACSDATGPSLHDLQAARSRWHGQQIHDYLYLYEPSGFNSQLSGRTILILVTADTVRAATDTLTGDSIPVAGVAFLTVDGLFDLATAELAGGTLNAISFDPALSYPVRIDLAGPPDASGTIRASRLQALLSAATHRYTPR